MQQDEIIVEILSRIEKLENEMQELKHLVKNQKQEQNNIPSSQPTTLPRRTTTDEMINTCYIYGKKFHEGADLFQSANFVAQTTGMNINSAQMYLIAVDSMLNDELYKDGINSKATRTYFDNIYKEQGSQGLKKAIHATELHISYRREHFSNNTYIDYLEKICNDYKKKL